MADGRLTNEGRTAIIGGGYSGAMLAARLAERGLASTVIERSGAVGLGAAYSTLFDGHLLNVRSNRMGAIEGRPGDFVDWLETRHPGLADPHGFAPRRLYGQYVRDRFETARAAHPALITVVTGEAAAIEDGGVILADGRRVEAGTVVLATGNPAPTAASDQSSDHVIHNPWAPEALDRIGPDDTVAVIGTGLTMVDMAVWLKARGWRGRMLALSRRGLRPRAHGEAPDAPLTPTPAMLEGTASARLRAGRRSADRNNWRSVMEGLRPITAKLWRAADARTRAAWVRRLRPWWDVHRHRIAPEIAREIDALVEAGRLEFGAAHITGVGAVGPGTLDVDTGRAVPAHKALLEYRPRRAIVPRGWIADWIIDCSGPGHDPTRDPLTGPLIAQGRARLDPLKLGLELDDQGRVLDVGGQADPRLFVLGPPARAAFWETVAVPDIRQRIEDVVAAIAEAKT